MMTEQTSYAALATLSAQRATVRAMDSVNRVVLPSTSWLLRISAMLRVQITTGTTLPEHLLYVPAALNTA